MKNKFSKLALAIALILAPAPVQALTKSEIALEALHRASVAFCHTRYTGESSHTSRIEARIAFVNFFAERMNDSEDQVLKRIWESEELQTAIDVGIYKRIEMICPEQIEERF